MKTTVLGVRTNLRFLRWLVDQPVMRDGDVRTDTVAGLRMPAPPIAGETHWRAAATLLAPGTSGPWSDGWRLNAPAVRRLRHADEDRTIRVHGELVDAKAERVDDVAHVDIEGQSEEFTLAPAPTVEEAVRHAAATGGTGTSVLVAPMPGRVVAVRATEGASVVAHQPIVIIEAMKMEHAVVSPTNGILSRVSVSEGQQVQRGQLLAELAAGR
jgi:biotin carboxyl carrier protein